VSARRAGAANIAALLAAGDASPGDQFVRLVPLKPDPNSVMHENYRWEDRGVPKDKRPDLDEGVQP